MYEINGAAPPFPSVADGPRAERIGGAFLPAMPGGFQSFGSSPLGGGSPDGVRPNWWNPTASSASGGDGGMLGNLQQLMSRFGRQVQGCMQNVMGMFGAGASGAGAPQPFADASLASVGDPHLSLSGTLAPAAGGGSIQAAFDSMSSQPDLFSSSSFAGGLVVSTQAGTPSANGVTYNADATARLDGGRDNVTMDADGTVTLDAGGTAVALADGSSTTLPGGATVSRAADGSVTIDQTNRWGGSLATTFRATGAGVDVTAQGENVALGGSLVSRALDGANGYA